MIYALRPKHELLLQVATNVVILKATWISIISVHKPNVVPVMISCSIIENVLICLMEYLGINYIQCMFGFAVSHLQRAFTEGKLGFEQK